MKHAIIMLFAVVLVGCGINQLEEPAVLDNSTIEVVEDFVIEHVDIVVDEGGCCNVSGPSCASGVGVTEDVCTGELSGVWVAGTKCNVDTGACE